VNDELKHNPYVGSFHGIQRPSEEQKETSIARHNPHLGIFRHSPAICALNLPVKLNLGFKGLLSDEPIWKTSVMSHIQVQFTSYTKQDSFDSIDVIPNPNPNPNPKSLNSLPIEFETNTNFQLHLTERLLNRIPTAIFSYPRYYNSNISNSGNCSSLTSIHENSIDIENGLEHIATTSNPNPNPDTNSNSNQQCFNSNSSPKQPQPQPQPHAHAHCTSKIALELDSESFS